MELNLKLIKKAMEISVVNEKFIKVINAIKINSNSDLDELYSLLLLEDGITELERDNYFGTKVLTFVMNGIYVTLKVGKRADFQVL